MKPGEKLRWLLRADLFLVCHHKQHAMLIYGLSDLTETSCWPIGSGTVAGRHWLFWIHSWTVDRYKKKNHLTYVQKKLTAAAQISSGQIFQVHDVTQVGQNRESDPRVTSYGEVLCCCRSVPGIGSYYLSSYFCETVFQHLDGCW